MGLELLVDGLHLLGSRYWWYWIYILNSTWSSVYTVNLMMYGIVNHKSRMFMHQIIAVSEIKISCFSYELYLKLSEILCADRECDRFRLWHTLSVSFDTPYLFLLTRPILFSWLTPSSFDTPHHFSFDTPYLFLLTHPILFFWHTPQSIVVLPKPSIFCFTVCQISL